MALPKVTKDARSSGQDHFLQSPDGEKLALEFL